jgi:hypothetical protein
MLISILVQDLEQLEEWNEFGEVKEAIGEVATTSTSVTTTPAKAPTASIPTSGTPSKPAAVAASASTSQGENANPTAQSSVMRQLADEAASTVQEKKKTPAPLNPTTNTSAAAVAATPAKDNAPMSPSSVPLPATPSLASPIARGAASPMRSASPLSSPTRPGHHGRHSSTGSTHSQSHFVPEHFEPPPITHRGSSISIASNDEIKKIENDETIHEAEEEEDCEDALKAKQRADKVKGNEKVPDTKKESEPEAISKGTELPSNITEEKEPDTTVEKDTAAEPTEVKISPVKKAEAVLAEAMDKVKIADKGAAEAE